MIQWVSDSPTALRDLKVAFRACPDSFETLKHEVKAGRVSLYELSGDDYRVTIAGEICGHSYFLWGVSGRGVIPAIRALKAYVKEAGLMSISAETHFPLVKKLCRRLNTTERVSGDVTYMEIKV
ncbi:DNAase [Vibrio cortegadensis]|uniref:DNAase n=1 Tax=Vibrio cortegadensis TaxID=1328770 RepID=UPI00352ECE97